MHSLFLSLLAAVDQVILCGLIFSAAWMDCRTFRIPNRLVLSGIIIGVGLNTAVPESGGSSSFTLGAIGISQALIGAGVGLGVLLPLYLTRTMGAGDVKLMSMIGTFLGPSPTISIILLSLSLGGVLSLLIAIRNNTLRLLFRNVYEILFGIVLHMPMSGIGKSAVPRQSAGRMPYALVIAGGVVLYLLLEHQNGISPH